MRLPPAARRAAAALADLLTGWALALSAMGLLPWLWSHGGWAGVGHRMAHFAGPLGLMMVGQRWGERLRARRARGRREPSPVRDEESAAR